MLSAGTMIYVIINLALVLFIDRMVQINCLVINTILYILYHPYNYFAIKNIYLLIKNISSVNCKNQYLNYLY